MSNFVILMIGAVVGFMAAAVLGSGNDDECH